MSNIKKNYIYNLLYQALNIILPIISTPYVYRILNPKGIGAFSYTYAIVSYFMMFCLLGVNNYGNREISKVRNDEIKRSNTFWQIYYLQLLCSTICLLAYCSIAIKLIQPEYKSISYVSILYMISSMLDINWLFFGMEQFRITVTRNIIIRVISFISLFIFIKSENDLIKYVIILSLSGVISNAVLWVFLRRFVVFFKPNLSEIKLHVIPNFILFIPVVAISLYEVMDKIMISLITDVIQTGIYEAANKIVRMPLVFFSALGTVMLPRICGLIADNQEKKADVYIRKSMGFVIFMASAMMFGILSVERRFFLLFFGNKFEDSIICFTVMAPVLFFSPWKSVIRTQCLIPRGEDKSYIISVALGAFVNLFVNASLIPWMGALGAAIGTFFAELTGFIYQSYTGKKYINYYLIFKDYGVFIINGLVMYAILRFVLDKFYDNNVFGLTIQIVTGAIIYISLSLVTYARIRRKSVKCIIYDLLKR